MSVLSPPHSVLDPHSAADHLPRLNRLATSLCGSRQLAEDLTQETYARVLSRPRALSGGNDYQYLAGTLRNVVHDHWRSEQRRIRLVPDDPPQHDDPEARAHAAEVFAAVATLPETYRHVVAAVDVAGMSYAQAAKTLGIPVGTVMSRLHRGRARLAGTIGEAA
jgi:RNA polymerase sigma-70 factor (ECF subfamily)